MSTRLRGFGFALLVVASCAQTGTPPLRTFNATAFAGLTSSEVSRYEDVVLDYDLDSSTGRPVHFTTCSQVEDTSDRDIAASDYPLFKLLYANCVGLKRYLQSRAAERTYFPWQVTPSLVEAFPAAAVPRMNDEDIARRQGKTLAAYDPSVRVSTGDDGSMHVATASDEIRYLVLGRADFTGDGTEDLLLRVDWHVRDAPGRGTDLFILEKTSEAAPIVVSWRL
jgi:hypothetical protein